MANCKTVPNQKVVRIKKKQITGNDLYAKIEMVALNNAAQDLQAGAFKLWIYFAKNQKEYEMALSSKDVEESFGMKIKQYNNAVKELTDKGYLVKTQGNNYFFYEVPVNTKGNNVSEKENPVILKGNNDVITKSNNDVILKGNNAVITKGNKKYNNNITNITNNITEESFSAKAEKSSRHIPEVSKEQREKLLTTSKVEGMGEFFEGWFDKGITAYPEQEWKGL